MCGYLPNDKSGDYVYQCVDICSMALIVYSLRSVLVTNRCSYQEHDDDMLGEPNRGTLEYGKVGRGINKYPPKSFLEKSQKGSSIFLDPLS